MSQRQASCQYLPQFLETVFDEIGPLSLANVLVKARLPEEWADLGHIRSLRGVETALVFAGLQRGLRVYYGRGARGALIRTGRGLWERLKQQAAFPLKVRASMVQARTSSARLEPALDVLAALLGARRGDMSAHPIDRGLRLEDRASPSTLDQREEGPICFVTLGLIQACLFWATGSDHDIEETCCRANGKDACEFEIHPGG